MLLQVAVGMVTIGVVAATISQPSGSLSSPSLHDLASYSFGIACLALSLILTGILGVLQEQTYSTFGSHWREGVFYTV
jgi:UDP-xylose/UDP-N-acetylglucosamine transporter B4